MRAAKVPGLIFARDLTQQVEKYHGKGGELAKQLVTLLADRPDLQREYLGGEVPKAPPIGTFKPGGEEGVKQWIDQDRVVNGLKPRYAIPISTNTRNTAPALPASSRAAPATQDTPDPKNLLEYGPNSGLPEDEGLRQAAAHDAERARQAAQNEQRPVPEYWPQGLPPTAEDWGLHQNPSPPDPPNPLPIDPSARTEADTQVAAAGTLANTEADPNQTTPVPKPNVPDAPPPPPLAPERRPYQAESDAVLASMIRNERAAASKAFAEQRQLGDRMRFLQQEIERSSKDTLLKAGHASGAGAAEGVAEELLERHVLHGPPQGRLPGGVTARSLTGAGLAGAVVSAGAATLHGRREVGELQAELESVVERLKAQFEVTQQIQRRRDELEAERTRRNGR